MGGFIVIGLVVGLVAFCLTRRSRRSSTSHNANRIEESQTQDVPTNIPPHMVPGFSSYVMPNAIPIHASRVSASQVSQPLYQTGFMVRTVYLIRYPFLFFSLQYRISLPLLILLGVFPLLTPIRKYNLNPNMWYEPVISYSQSNG